MVQVRTYRARARHSPTGGTGRKLPRARTALRRRPSRADASARPAVEAQPDADRLRRPADRNKICGEVSQPRQIGTASQESGRGAHDDRRGTNRRPPRGDCQPDAHTPVDGDESTIRRGCGITQLHRCGRVSGLCRWTAPRSWGCPVGGKESGRRPRHTPATLLPRSRGGNDLVSVRKAAARPGETIASSVQPKTLRMPPARGRPGRRHTRLLHAGRRRPMVVPGILACARPAMSCGRRRAAHRSAETRAVADTRRWRGSGRGRRERAAIGLFLTVSGGAGQLPYRPSAQRPTVWYRSPTWLTGRPGTPGGVVGDAAQEVGGCRGWP